MNLGNLAINSLLKQLESCKTPSITLKNRIVRSSQSATSEGGRARGVTNTPVSAAQGTKMPQEPSAHVDIPFAHRGDEVAFSGVATRNGYIHLFNLGISGTCLKLSPSAMFPENGVQRNDVFHLPSPKLLDSRALDGASGFRVYGQTTEETGRLDFLLVLILDSSFGDTDLQLSDLHPDLKARSLLQSRGGFGGAVKVSRSKLFQQPELWDYGLLRMRVL